MPNEPAGISLAPNSWLTVVVPTGSTAQLVQLAASAGDAALSSVSLAAGTHRRGPFDGWTRWSLQTVTGNSEATYSISQTDPNVGTVSVAGITALDYDEAVVHRTVFTLQQVQFTLTDDPAVGQYGSIKLYDFPAGDILILGSVVDLALTLVGAPWKDTAEGDLALGVAAVTDGDALATDEVSVVPSTAIAALVAQAGPMRAQSTAQLVSPQAGATDLDLYLNVRIDDDAAHVTAANNLVSGTITLVWVALGDF